jgi:hypothetical protein
VHPKLTWVGGLQSSLGLALGTSISHTIEDTVDPLMKLVTLQLGEDLGKGDYNPVQKMVHAFAKSNDCVVYRIRREPKKLVLEVLTKTRLGQVMNKNPLADGDKG